MSTEAAGEATQETVGAGRDMTAADSAGGGPAGMADQAGPGPGPDGLGGAADGGEADQPDPPGVTGETNVTDAVDEADGDIETTSAGEIPVTDGARVADAHAEATTPPAGDATQAGDAVPAGAEASDPDEAQVTDETGAVSEASVLSEADVVSEPDADGEGEDGVPPDEGGDSRYGGYPDEGYADGDYQDDDYEDDYPDDADGDGEAGGGRRGRRWSRVLLVGGFVLAAAAIVGGALAIVGSVTHGFKKPVKVTYKKSAVFSLKTGDCLNPQGQEYTLIPCDTPHQAEVFATFKLPGGTWPGNSAMSAAASQGCATRLTGYLNPQLAVSLASTYVYPDATAWKAGTRTVICEVRAASGELTGSVRGATATAG